MLASNALPDNGPPPVTVAYDNKTPLSYEDFFVWLQTPAVGSRCVYHFGFLPVDRFWDDQMSPESIRKAKAINEYAGSVFQLYEKGQVALSQRRMGLCHYRYFATKK